MSRRVLLVEDEMLIAMHMEDLLTDLGLEVVGPAMRLNRALELAERERLDFAVLDINLANENSFSVARILRERNVPFAFVSGYGTAGLGDEFAGTPVLQKPVEKHQLARIMEVSPNTSPPTSERTRISSLAFVHWRRRIASIRSILE